VSDEPPVHALDTRALAERVRRLPEGERKRRLQGRLGEVMALLASPRCGDMQADGAPCASAGSSCDVCGRALELVERLVREIEE
jgi:hypothetical protein